MYGQYQLLIQNHLIEMFKKKPLVSDTVLFMVDEKEFIIEMALKWGYIPAFGEFSGDYQTVNFIEKQPPC